MPYRDETFELFIAALKEKIPERGKLTNKLVEILMIEKEAIHRRLRGEVPFIFSEIANICEQLGLSMDSILSRESTKCRPIQLKMVDYVHFNEEDARLLENFLESLRTVKDCPNSEVGGALNIIPQSLCLGFIHLYRFYLFKWRYQAGEDPFIIHYKDVQPPQRLREINQQIIEATQEAASTYLIWDNMTFTNLVNDITYFTTINLITPEEKEIIKQEIYEFLDYLELLAARGSHENGNKVHFYVSSITFETSMSYVESPEVQMTMVKSFTLNDATSTDPKIFEKMKKWMHSLKRTSTLISESGEMQRILFFDKQRRIVDTL
ncbi:MAG: hypothetical protein LUG51_11860 [Tannerellaceae bacterium]|nr:hypothetical protein [Tannerellaceae bacterium]